MTLAPLRCAALPSALQAALGMREARRTRTADIITASLPPPPPLFLITQHNALINGPPPPARPAQGKEEPGLPFESVP